MAVVFILRRPASGAVELCTAADLDGLEAERIAEAIALLVPGQTMHVHPTARPEMRKRPDLPQQACPSRPERVLLPIRRRKV